MCLQQGRKASMTQLRRARRLEYFSLWANELKALLKMLDALWSDKPADPWISSRARESSALPAEAQRREHCHLAVLERGSESLSWTLRQLSKGGLSGHRAGESSAQRGCWTAMKVHALPLLLFLFWAVQWPESSIPRAFTGNHWSGAPFDAASATGSSSSYWVSVLLSPLSTCARGKVKISWVESVKYPPLKGAW